MKEKYKVNLLIYIFIAYICYIIINDILTYFLPFNKIINYAISLFIVIFLHFFIRKKFLFEKNSFYKSDIIFIFSFIGFFLLRIFLPDSSFDVLNYHLYLQEMPFKDNINVNFFPARWINTYSFPLCDRMHYFFRLITNYHFGMILNLFVLCIIYSQVKRILIHFNVTKNYFVLCFLSFLTIITEQILCNSITYYVDILCIPLFLEIIIYIINNKKENPNNYFVLLMAGILVSMKISNAILLIFLAIIYIIKYKKTINYKTILFGTLIFVAPLYIYILNNYLQTGNPVFPFYNSIFHSRYLSNINWIEEYYGPKTILELFIWPIYILFNPRRAYDTSLYTGRISIGYIASLIIIVYYLVIFIKKIKTKKNKNNLIDIDVELLGFAIIYVIFCLLWGKFLMGYIRYVLILEILSGIIVIILLQKIIKSKLLLFNLTFFIVIMFFSIQICYSLKLFIFSSNELSWRPTITSEDGYNKLLTNFDSTFENKSYSKYLKNISCFAISDYNAGYAALLSNSIPIISLSESYTNNFGLRQFNKVIKRCNNLYTITTKFTIDRTKIYLQKLNYKLTDNIIYINSDFVDQDNELLLIQIEKEK